MHTLKDLLKQSSSVYIFCETEEIQINFLNQAEKEGLTGTALVDNSEKSKKKRRMKPNVSYASKNHFTSIVYSQPISLYR